MRRYLSPSDSATTRSSGATVTPGSRSGNSRAACGACVVAGFRTPEEVVSAARWVATELTQETWLDLDTAAARAAEVPPA
ncbi:hypothetical protein [Streptomyces sp. NPDC101455]|uniref:hypothetical protein n=1 Tax=Streptomyces sp. NPDC101455 TaxID=3366142 RepID=UPI00380EA4D2